MRLFQLHRSEDPFNVTGTGHVADGVEFDDGTVVVRWRTATPSTVAWDDMDDAVRVHGHEGSTTRVVFLGYDGHALVEAPEPPAVTGRGFGTYAVLNDTYGRELSVQQSSSAEDDAVWIYVEGGNAAAHLDADMAVKVRDALNAWLHSISHPATWQRTDAEAPEPSAVDRNGHGHTDR